MSKGDKLFYIFFVICSLLAILAIWIWLPQESYVIVQTPAYQSVYEGNTHLLIEAVKHKTEGEVYDVCVTQKNERVWELCVFYKNGEYDTYTFDELVGWL